MYLILICCVVHNLKLRNFIWHFVSVCFTFDTFCHLLRWANRKVRVCIPCVNAGFEWKSPKFDLKGSWNGLNFSFESYSSNYFQVSSITKIVMDNKVKEIYVAWLRHKSNLKLKLNWFLRTILRTKSFSKPTNKHLNLIENKNITKLKFFLKKIQNVSRFLDLERKVITVIYNV